MSRERQLFMTTVSYRKVAVSNESVTVPAGAAGTVVNFYLEQKPIADSNGAFIGGPGDTSVVLGGSTFTTEVAQRPDAELTNGQYWVDYVTGKCRGKKADTATSVLASYSILR